MHSHFEKVCNEEKSLQKDFVTDLHCRVSTENQIERIPSFAQFLEKRHFMVDRNGCFAECLET